MSSGGAVVNKEYIGGNRVWGLVTFYWLSYASPPLPLAGVLLGEEKSFLPPSEVVKLYHFLPCLFLLGSYCELNDTRVRLLSSKP